MAEFQGFDDDERGSFVVNDEALNEMLEESGLELEEFVEQNRELIDDIARPVVEGTARAHWLKYGP